MTRRTPTATYRLQLHKEFTFDDAAAIADYLHALGISHVYCSPYLQPVPGSKHGYDVVDPQRVNGELGGAPAHERFCMRLGEVGLGQVLDIVPNHMSLGKENRYWWDVLENGPLSRYASYFDIDWRPQEERLRDKVLVPILPEQYGRALQDGAIKVTRNGVRFQVEASGQTFPVAPISLPAILVRAADYARSDTLNFLAASFGRLPSPEYFDRRTILARDRDKLVLFRLLARLCDEEPKICEMIDRSIEELNSNLDALDDFLNQQIYRLAYWKTADQQLGYRRFFDVNTLIGVRVEREHVFEETHALILDWLKRGVLDGVRVDHPDGLRDPLEYFRRLRDRAPEVWIVGEKILEPGEFLHENWPIEGTVGYDFLNQVNGVLVSQRGVTELRGIYTEFTGQPGEFESIAHDKKINVMQEALGSDVNRLTSLFVEICEANRNRRDYTSTEIRRAIREIAACFRIYRTYVVPARNEITDADRRAISEAAECGKLKRHDIDAGLFDFLRDVLTMEVSGKKETEFLQLFQQFTGPVMAKGVEDTAFYCFNRLVGLNEVGSDPGRDGISLAEFHGYCYKMHATRPLTMTTLSTHDTKRSDDVRARLAVLSEVPGRFHSAIQRWSRINREFRVKSSSGVEHPDRNTEYFYYQTLVGAWPLPLDRAQSYMLKAVREAKQQTTWVANNKEFEEALHSFIEKTLAHQPFTEKLEEFVRRIRDAGRVNSLAQTLLKHVVPGVPDLYQGDELWDLSLVDPDNRRPVDYDLRRRLLEEIQNSNGSEIVSQILRRADEGLPKLWTIHQALLLRREHPEWFGCQAAYTPLLAEGSKAEHVLACMRGDSVIAVAPRLFLTLDKSWRRTRLALPQGHWKNRLTREDVPGGNIEVESLLRQFPVALLTRETGNDA
ncbi:MAG: malto-oligosyltrehalose synthase [Silvibacterium sp.]|nr:malto-oligosyltrehalose synthase [Silvibacterium sp.]MBV8438439.1 malto-oligosyltrehalose synthase [Silvibacterium sp.]